MLSGCASKEVKPKTENFLTLADLSGRVTLKEDSPGVRVIRIKAKAFIKKVSLLAELTPERQLLFSSYWTRRIAVVAQRGYGEYLRSRMPQARYKIPEPRSPPIRWPICLVSPREPPLVVARLA